MRRFARIRTKNYTARPLRGSILVDDFAIVRLGSLTPTSRIFPTRKDVVEINTVESIQNSRNKLLMKECFSKLDIPQADWWTYIPGQNIFPVRGIGDKGEAISTLPFPLVVKRVYGFQGRDMDLLNSKEDLRNWLSHHHDADGWLFERFFNGSREYRFHVASGIGCFMSWRKLRTKESTKRWFFNSDNSNWVGPEHKLFDKPKCWDDMEKAAMNCLKSTGLDLGACDIRVQSSKHKNPKFIVCEINSAPSLGDYGIEKYKEIIKQLIVNKNV
jgi:carbamoylphosphate synthase large subunit